MVRRLAYRRAALAAVAATAPGDEDRRRGGNAAGLAGRLAVARTGVERSGAGYLVQIARDGCGRAYGRHARSAGARRPLSRTRACGRRRAAPARRRAVDRRAQALSGRIPARRARYRRPARLERDRLHLRSHHERQRHARLTTAAHRSPAWGKLALFVVALVALGAARRYTPLARVASRQRILEWARVARTTRWAPFALAAAYIPAAFIMFPRPLLSLLAIVAFGVWVGGAVVAAGVLGAALASYFLGRQVSRATVRRLAGRNFERLSALLREHAIAAVFAANMLPAPPFVVQGMMAGAIRMKLWKYTAGTVLSLAPGLLAVLVFGHQISPALEDASKVS